MSAQYHHGTYMRIADNQTKRLERQIQTAVQNNSAQYSRSDNKLKCDYFNKTEEKDQNLSALVRQ